MIKVVFLFILLVLSCQATLLPSIEKSHDFFEKINNKIRDLEDLTKMSFEMIKKEISSYFKDLFPELYNYISEIIEKPKFFYDFIESLVAKLYDICQKHNNKIKIADVIGCELGKMFMKHVVYKLKKYLLEVMKEKISYLQNHFLNSYLENLAKIVTNDKAYNEVFSSVENFFWNLTDFIIKFIKQRICSYIVSFLPSLIQNLLNAIMSIDIDCLPFETAFDYLKDAFQWIYEKLSDCMQYYLKDHIGKIKYYLFWLPNKIFYYSYNYFYYYYSGSYKAINKISCDVGQWLWDKSLNPFLGGLLPNCKDENEGAHKNMIIHLYYEFTITTFLHLFDATYSVDVDVIYKNGEWVRRDPEDTFFDDDF